MALLSNINWTVPYSSWQARKKYIFAQESFYLQGILDDINEQDTSFPDCKHKHMMKSGTPPDKFGVLYCTVTYRIPWFHSLVPGLISNFFRDGMGPFKIQDMKQLGLLTSLLLDYSYQ